MIGSLFSLARPLIHKLDAETAHRLTVAGLAAAPLPRPTAPPITRSWREGWPPSPTS